MIKGNKVHLRPIVKSDIKLLNEWKNDEEVYKFLGGGFNPISIDQQNDWMEYMIDMTGNNRRFMICDKYNAAIGMVGLYNISWIHRSSEIGIYIGDRSSKGNGFAKEACNLIEKFAREYLNLRKIKLSVVSDNNIALSMWNSLGYNKIGEFKKERYIKGCYYNLIIMEKFL